MLFFNLFVFSQEVRIKKNEVLPHDLDFTGRVKKITITDFISNKQNTNVDSVRAISETNFAKNGKIELVKSYVSFLNNSWKIIELDKLERITKISFKRGDSITNPIKQYYSNDSNFPDSTLINTDKNYKEKYVNTFNNKKVVKYEYFVNDKLKDFRIYKYNDKGQLIEDFYTSTENDSDQTLISKEADNGVMLSFYPERKIFYEYEKKKDTIITITIRPKFAMKEIRKSLKKPNFNFEIFEKYENNILVKKEITTTLKDSISEFHFRYDGNGQIDSYYNTFTNPRKRITKYTLSKNDKESLYIVNIDIVYDRFKNWIKKTYLINDKISGITERKIEYH
ncbi:hypothetical protein [Flavobacterium quisquiliarum]|uniref:YD repeat-containing protein n=1 Tax=Flavobacterium quisquiliarum TaxID=1834436 RepID=A0ABV8W1F4_9FLAO|nr:hypothetical protein [Flavobacterium quisquiliarum]MBW1655113.1 hypothetical protein [Flavobacterium quisquiliarum]